MQTKRNVVLCGFMGCGKTTLGPLIANSLGLTYVDSDKVVEEQEGMRIPEIFRLFDEQGFREREHQAILDLSAKRGLVISTGGGVFTYPANVAPLRESGVLLYVNPSFEECYRRIQHSDRPIVRRSTVEELARLYRTRDKLYRAAAHLELILYGDPQDWLQASLQLLDLL